jgi:prophage tail gpP-like protein
VSVRVFIDRQELTGYTDLTLSRAKDALTGELNISVFMGWLPTEPVLVGAQRGREVLVYIGGRLAFTGIIDRRQDAGTVNLDANSYTVTFRCRGKTKYLIDSSHQHPTCTMLRPTARGVVEELLAPFGVALRWDAADPQFDKIRFRDGGRVVDELQRVAEQAGLFIFEGRDGRLGVTDGKSAVQGEPLVLGKNILQFSADQAEDPERSEILVKGQRIEAKVWGDAAVIETMERAANAVVQGFAPITVQLYGDATPEALKRRVQYEANKRSAAAKKITLDVFHVQQMSGQPWDIGDLHYVEIPPAGVFGLMEVTDLTYTVQPDQTLKTMLTLSPAPVQYGGAGAGSGFLAGLPEIDLGSSLGVSRAGSLGVAVASSIWGSPALSALALPSVAQLLAPAAELLGSLTGQGATPPLTLPESLQ